MPVCLEVAETATKPSPAPLQKHSLGDATGQAGAVRGYPTSAVSVSYTHLTLPTILRV